MLWDIKLETTYEQELLSSTGSPAQAREILDSQKFGLPELFPQKVDAVKYLEASKLWILQPGLWVSSIVEPKLVVSWDAAQRRSRLLLGQGSLSLPCQIGSRRTYCRVCVGSQASRRIGSGRVSPALPRAICPPLLPQTGLATTLDHNVPARGARSYARLPIAD